MQLSSHVCCSGPGTASSILVQGRRCEVSLALSQDAARTLAAGAPQQGEGRRLYLVSAVETVIEAAAAAASSLVYGGSSTGNLFARQALLHACISAGRAALLAMAVQYLIGVAAQAKEGAIEEGSPAWAHMSAGVLHVACLLPAAWMPRHFPLLECSLSAHQISSAFAVRLLEQTLRC